jgi:hypothetical protein
MEDDAFLRLLDESGLGAPSPEGRKISPKAYTRDDPLFVDLSADSLSRASSPRGVPGGRPLGRVSRDEFVQFQLKVISQEIEIGASLVRSKPTAPVVELGVDCDTLDDFFRFKRRLATQYRDVSRQNGWEDDICICLDPICLNPAVPGFEFCANHLALSERFDQQFLLSQCTHTVGKTRCPRPCSPEERVCRLHTKTMRTAPEKDLWAT